MKTNFEKIYVISPIENKNRREFIKYQMRNLGLDFEFIYGIDFNNLKHDQYGEDINYPDLIYRYNHLNNDKLFGLTMAHYYAVLNAYELRYNNVLIIEDDICFLNDKNELYFILSSIPNDIDFITFTSRFKDINEVMEFKEYQKMFDDGNSNTFIEIPNYFKTLCGALMYGLMNRKTMQLYLNNQKIMLNNRDCISNIYINPTIKRYTTLYSICIDQFSRSEKTNKYDKFNLFYEQCNIVKNFDNYFKE